MPMYEYICDKCKSTQDHIVKSVDVKVKCKDCGHSKLTRKFPTGTNFKLMGGGWTGSN